MTKKQMREHAQRMEEMGIHMGGIIITPMIDVCYVCKKRRRLFQWGGSDGTMNRCGPCMKKQQRSYRKMLEKSFAGLSKITIRPYCPKEHAHA